MFWIQIILFLLPLYFANSGAVISGGKTPLDFNMRAWDGKRWFGKGKTYKGTVAGIFIGTLSAMVIINLVPAYTTSIAENYVLFGFLVSIGAMLGDIVGSFLKRRINIESGKPLFLLDQLDFLVGGVLLGSIFFVPSLWQLAAMVIITFLAHRFFNWIAFKAQLKAVPW
ncbi:CDP-2,3-bis-(O-geranylgeranyl)-sn-glycerol synthase [Candidatus Micrarchaeota archaeon]|nr:CDP-2,3-bis-(O-geranylgeranyl)-sn-glycerol synthase [Candidatus Micrarchaeota archaeon]MBU1930348.1 CDP-2,3-bis-(O-geranylgeranyl)-sn-glycerol synthase [Candidatus Micrarchaeota archaeon]